MNFATLKFVTLNFATLNFATVGLISIFAILKLELRDFKVQSDVRLKVPSGLGVGGDFGETPRGGDIYCTRIDIFLSLLSKILAKESE